MSRFRRIRRTRHDDRKSTQAADRGAGQALSAGGNAGAGTWHAVPPGGIYGSIFGAGGVYGYGNSYQNVANAGLNAYLSAPNAYTQQAAIQQLRLAQLNLSHQAYLQNLAQSLPPPEPEKPLPREIRAGEIIGYRAWILGADGSYWSTAHPVQWVGGRMDGVVGRDHQPHSGVHAWKDRRRAREYAQEMVVLGFDIAFGEVMLWGDVVEHEDGYRAEHAEIGTIYEEIDGAYWPNSGMRTASSYAHIPMRPIKPPPPKLVETTASLATPAKRDPITIAGWAIFAWLAAFCVMISTGAMSPF